MVRRIERDVYP